MYNKYTVKIKQKVSQCFRTFKGAENYTTIENFIC